MLQHRSTTAACPGRCPHAMPTKRKRHTSSRRLAETACVDLRRLLTHRCAGSKPAEPGEAHAVAGVAFAGVAVQLRFGSGALAGQDETHDADAAGRGWGNT